jgi:predicted nucleic acid-binding protein
MSYLLDSTVLVDALRGHPGATAFLRSSQDPMAASEVTRVEILRGLRSSERALVERLFLLLDWHSVDESIARVAGEFGRRYRRSHTGIGVSDLIVAATAKHVGLALATSNAKHFPMFPRLTSPY